ncbi:MAG: chemotaxis protein [Alphaproteobacteria bacterium CG_4_9_14_3_um_filter_47_13]|nr:MAG: chemotaxis protein [Alphaproteobacteria bacterium CG_4_9_14_3_um_filter_47_13]
MSENAHLKSAAYGRDQVVSIINSVIDKVHKTDFAAKDVLFQELHDLKMIIDDSRKQLGSARAGDINGVHIPAATDELDAIVGATEEATGAIMDACEVIQEHMGKMDSAVAALVEAEVTKIFEACSFQDITGQRVSNVVGTLKTIDEKVGKILHILDESVPDKEDQQKHIAAEEAEKTEAERLLNGPQLPGNAISQEDIDKLLSAFDD